MNIYQDKRGAINLRTEEKIALIRIESEILKAARDYLSINGFFEVIVPHITNATGACENPDTLFEVINSDNGFNPYLSQTSQLYLETIVPILQKVWCYGPSFRKEKDIDQRHLTEFNLLELEFCGNLDQLLSIIEELIKIMIKAALQCKNDLKILGGNWQKLETVLNTPFEKITYDEAINILNLKWGEDLNSDTEKILLEIYKNNPIFITHFPGHIKFFNMKTNLKNPKIVNSADLLLPFSGEAVGAAEREYIYEIIKKKLEQSSMFKQLQNKSQQISDFNWYLSYLKENENCPHAGCGIGIERVLQFILAKNDIHNSILFPIDSGNIF